MTPEDRAKVENLRTAVKDDLTPYYDTDFNLLRWLQGYNYNMNVIVPKLRFHLRFRKSCWDLDNMHKRPRDHNIQNHWPDGVTGLAGKDTNAIVNIDLAGSVDYWGILDTYTVVEAIKSRVHDLEIMFMEVMKQEEKSGKQSSIIYIVDLKGLKHDKRLLSLVSGPLKFFSQFMADHYVEMIKYFVIVNAPSFMRNFWWIIYPLLPERTRNKMHILSNNWRKEILEYADSSVLPTIWNPEGEFIFSAEILPALKFDEKNYYVQLTDEDYMELNVRAGNVEFISVFAEQGSILKWTIRGDGDFGFGVFRADDEDERDETKTDMVYPHFTKLFSPLAVPLMDSLVCKKPGYYKFWLSNRHAWWHTLNVYYRIGIELSPDLAKRDGRTNA